MFSDSDSENEDINQLTINEHYAKAFEYRKEREELAKLKEKYGSDAEDIDDEEDSEDLESEDEDGEELTPAMDAAILRTLARIKRKDPAIYEQGKDVFEEEKAKTGEAKITVRPKQDKSKPLTMRQHALASALNPDSRSPSPEPLTYVQEQEALKKETVQAFHTAVGDDDDDDLLVLREKTKDEIEREEEEYKEFLEREVGEDLKELITVTAGQEKEVSVEDVEEESSKAEKKRVKKEKKKSKEKGGKSKEDEDQQFLLDYILNRGWIDKASRRLPTYKEITAETSSKKISKGKEKPESDSEDGHGEEDTQDAPIDEDVEFEDIVDRFESSYNFRFEEPDAANIARYPRNIASAVRREDTTRKEARERRKQRKEEELLQKREEVKRLKALKMKELRSKLEKIGKEGGKSLEDEALRVLDLDADWDPEAHDRQMADLYAQGEDVPVDDDEKPVWDDDIDIGDIVPEEDLKDDKKKKKKKKKKKGGDEEKEEGGVDIDEMDADVERPDVQLDEEEWDGTEEMRKKVLDKYIDELYDMEFNDLVGDMPTRFKYTKVQPASYSLTPVEILLAKDSELNQFMGLKQIAPYRDKKQERWDRNRNAKVTDLKQQLDGRRWGDEVYGEHGIGSSAGANREDRPKKRKGKKERMKMKANVGDRVGGTAHDDGQGEATVNDVEASGISGKKRKAEGDTKEEVDGGEVVSSEGPSKKRRRRHKKSGVSVES
ncbi:KRI1-like family C-terminal-domain-containing protein [Cristinia sonorae]|uniref:KRI1-like family C-terminal-domain-containing protein n=1 Tax=Cristinia sonorae TaxID=1940300 RepID=A0A8K0XT04_9AGAR|nr:KRI1-like family C-terminal-domain-containing protein [Cristinia sonorae]